MKIKENKMNRTTLKSNVKWLYKKLEVFSLMQKIIVSLSNNIRSQM